MSDVVAAEMQFERKRGGFSRNCKNNFSFIIVCEGQFYELKGKYNKDHPPGWWAQAQMLVKQYKSTIKRTCELMAHQVMERSQTPCKKARYVETISSSKGGRQYDRHVTTVVIHPIDRDSLLADGYLNSLRVPVDASHTKQVSAAILELPVIKMQQRPVLSTKQPSVLSL